MSEPQKEAFRKYLDSAGVIDALTSVLVNLYEEPDKPKTAVDFIKASLGGPTPAEYETLRAERDALASELTIVKQTIAELQAKVQEAEAAKTS